MKFLNIFLTVFALTVNARNPDYVPPYVRMNSFSYAAFCNEGDCDSIRTHLANAHDAINKVVVFSPAIYYEAFVDSISKYRLNTTEVAFAATIDPETYNALSIDKKNEKFDFQNNVISPYPNPGILKYHRQKFNIILNNFLEEGVEYSKLNYDFENIYKKVLLKTLATFDVEYLKKSRPPPPDKPFDNTNGFVPPPPDGAPPPPGGALDDVASILERRFDEENLINKFIQTDKGCEEERKNEVYKVFNWKDYLISKGNNKHTTELNYNRVIAVGDIHGDYQKLEDVLRHAKLIDSNNNWIATNTALVQTGDLIDRGGDIKKILDLLLSLREQAKSKNSEVILLFGNHEIMNFRGDYGFVSYVDVQSFGGLSQREQDFSATGKYGKIMRKEMKATTALNDSVFIHAGLLPEYAKDGIDTINAEVQRLLVNAPSFEELYEIAKTGSKPELYTSPYLSEKGPLFNRDLIQLEDSKLCPQVEETLRLTNTKRMIVGHNPQDYGEIRSRCGGKIIFIDLGMSSCYGNFFGYVEINENDEIWARYRN